MKPRHGETLPPIVPLPRHLESACHHPTSLAPTALLQIHSHTVHRAQSIQNCHVLPPPHTHNPGLEPILLPKARQGRNGLQQDIGFVLWKRSHCHAPHQSFRRRAVPERGLCGVLPGCSWKWFAEDCDCPYHEISWMLLPHPHD